MLWIDQEVQSSVAHLRGCEGRPPPGSKFFQFHAVFGEIWQNHMLAPPLGGVGAPSSGKSWIRHWSSHLTADLCCVPLVCALCIMNIFTSFTRYKNFWRLPPFIEEAYYWRWIEARSKVITSVKYLWIECFIADNSTRLSPRAIPSK